jgi:uroporphyrinogen-III synthase
MKLLIIRPQPGADATAARILKAGHEALLMPFFAVEPVAWDAPPAQGYDAILLTSANAVREAGPQLAAFADLPAYSVGKVTAAAADQAGLRVTHSGSAGAAELVNSLKDIRLLWLAGEDHSQFATPASVEIDLRVVYRSAALPIPSDFSDVTRQADHVLLHSARAAQRFSILVAEQGLDRAGISIAVLSKNIAVAAGDGWKSVHVASEPTDAALLSCL